MLLRFLWVFWSSAILCKSLVILLWKLIDQGGEQLGNQEDLLTCLGSLMSVQL